VTSELHVVVPGPLDQLTGGYVYDAAMVRGLRDLGWKVHVHNLAGRFPDPDAEAIEALSATLAGLPSSARVLIDGLAMGGLPEPIEGHADRLRIVGMVHHPLAEETGLSIADKERLIRTERRALAAVTGVIVTSGFTASALEPYGVAPDQVRVAPPGIDPARPAVGPAPGRPPTLLCVASVTPRKGHDVLVAALAEVRDLAWTCVCVGSTERDRDHAEVVRSGVARAGLRDRVSFVGEREGEELEAHFHGASVFVLASHYEGYGMVLAEAIARGLPVVSTTGGAIPFTVPADAGLLVPPGDAAAFAGALRAVLEPGATLRDELADAARRHAARLPTWSDAARVFAAAVDDLTR
jgi:glycosyltransferase involved in cell wall biosynthesis